jgi:sugar O-acyltransferase (sialic acid O-acetyltransferase NeuD family)
MTRDLVIVGCGGFGREAADVVAAINSSSADDPPWNTIGFLDDDPSDDDLARLQRLGLNVLGDVDGTVGSLGDTHYVVAVGDPHARARLAGRCESAGLTPATLVHPSARVGSDVTIGEGTILCGGASITTNVRIGRHVQVNPNATVGHDVTIGDFVLVSPLVAISGNCTIEELTMLGTHSAVLPGVTVASGATVGGGSCVVRDVPSSTTVKGVPAR